MPELPEVETIRRELSPHVTGHRIIGVTLNWEKVVKEPSPQEFVERIAGQTIEGIDRRGKYLFFRLSGGDVMLAHMKMTGSLIIGALNSSPPQYTRAVIHLDNANVYFRDPRKFGVLKLLKNDNAIVAKLGPEPLEPGFTAKILKERLGDRSAPIKAVLIDQGVIAGIGNMYADEALFAARIHPMRPASSLTAKENRKLFLAIREVLEGGLALNGASTDTYYRPDGSRGTAQFEFKVAHSGGKPCTGCDGKVERIVVRGRGTYYCPSCQKMN